MAGPIPTDGDAGGVGSHTDTILVARSGHGGRNAAGDGQGVPFADRVGASWRGWFLGPDGGSAGWLPPSGWERQGAQSGQGATELGFPWPMLGQMQSEAARRAGEPSGEGEEASSEGLGGYDLLTQTEPRRPAGQQLCWLSRKMGNFGGTRTTPCRVIFDHGV